MHLLPLNTLYEPNQINPPNAFKLANVFGIISLKSSEQILMIFIMRNHTWYNIYIGNIKINNK